MRTLFRTITYILRSWLNSLRGRPAAGRVGGRLGGVHHGETSQEDGEGLEADDGQSRDEAHKVANPGEPEPPDATIMDAADPQPPSGEIAGLTTCALDEASAGDSPSPARTTESGKGTTLAHDAGDNVGDGGKCTSGESDRHDNVSGMHDEDGEDTTGDEARPCPRCKVKCPADEVERVFGYRTMRWLAAGTETTVVRRQSYCRQCRAEHAAETRRGHKSRGRSGEKDLGGRRSDPAESEHPHHDVKEIEMPIDPVTETGPGNDLVDRVGRLVPETRSEEITTTNGEITDSKFDDATLGSDCVDASEPSAAGDLDGDERHAREEPDGKRARDETSVGVVEEEGGATRDGHANSVGGASVSTKPDADGIDSERPTSRPPSEWRRRPPQYRAPIGGPPPRRLPSQSQTTVENADASRARGQPVAIEVRVLFQRGGCCSVSLLPKRLPGLPEELVAASEAGDVELVALQDEWYQDVVPNSLAEILRTGLVWNDPDTGQEWLLSGREVFVLAHGTTHRGFVSCPRLALGRNHVVLCIATRLSAVGDALRAAGCAGWDQLGEDDGAPPGWRVLRQVVPQRPVPLSTDADILNVLRPLPEIEIGLEGGIRLAYNSWLYGHPPAIHIYGRPEHTESVVIDGQEAAGSELDAYTAPGWEDEGKHYISCSSTNRSYSLVRCETNWTYWPAYSYSLRSVNGEGHEFEFCGPLVRPVTTNVRRAQRQVVQIPPTNPVLLGASPGEVFFAHRRLEVWGAQCFGVPPFDPLWALPAEPLQCNKRTHRIMLVGEPTTGIRDAILQAAKGSRDLERWCRLVLDASRKGLAVEPATPATLSLWREYKQHAKSLWRRFR